jgi:hypothetical protein
VKSGLLAAPTLLVDEGASEPIGLVSNREPGILRLLSLCHTTQMVTFDECKLLISMVRHLTDREVRGGALLDQCELP